MYVCMCVCVYAYVYAFVCLHNICLCGMLHLYMCAVVILLFLLYHLLYMYVGSVGSSIIQHSLQHAINLRSGPICFDVHDYQRKLMPFK